MRRVAVLIFACLSLTSSPAEAEWRRAVSTHFTLYSEGRPDQLRAAAERLERFDALLRRLSPVPPRETPVRLTIYMPNTRDALLSLTDSFSVAGFYRGRAEGPFLVAPRRDFSLTLDSDTILFHEYVHHFMLHNYATVYPSWFVEGYAELLSNARFDENSILIGSFAEHRARELGLPSPALRSLMFESPRRMRGTNATAFYANAWLLTHYLALSESRAGQLGRYFAMVGEGRTPEAAAEAAFGSLDTMQRDLRRYRSGGYIPTLTIRFDEAPPIGPITVEELSPGEEQITWLLLQYRAGVPRRERAGFARRVRARATEAPNDPATLQLLADTEYLVGDYAAAGRAIDTLLAVQPDAPRALLRKGLVEIRLLEHAGIRDAARWTAARDWIRRANLANPDDPLVLVEYYRAFQRQRAGRPPANAADGLARAYELVPQDFALRTLYAERLIGERRYRAATTVLGPVAYSAHGSPQSEAAARRLDAIRGLADGADPPPPPPVQVSGDDERTAP